MEKLMNLNNSLFSKSNNEYYFSKNDNECNILIYEYLKISTMYTNINKKNCVTNSCRRRKEEILGCLKNIHKQIEICE
tara:strand:+ start:5624 stop:5857 length:234 start_codon:yes stop_codon:yes gene_type:complete